MYKHILKPIFFLFDPETIHHTVFRMLAIIYRIPGIPWLLKSTYRIRDTKLQREVMGLKFDNPVGLAAGFDKDAKLVDCMNAMGFGFIEIGTLTPRPQPGNPRPRLFRLPQDHGLINRMGFNNEGVLAAVERLKWKDPSIIVGGNIGKNKDTPNEKAVEDYEYCFEALYDLLIHDPEEV
jgi:dihydroorotate dehydrogenase